MQQMLENKDNALELQNADAFPLAKQRTIHFTTRGKKKGIFIITGYVMAKQYFQDDSFSQKENTSFISLVIAIWFKGNKG